jgi:CysZ protein
VASVVSELASGVGLLGRGMAMVVRRPRMALLGAIPVLITSVLFTAVLVLLFTELDPLVAWLTPFADGWSSGAALGMRVIVGLSLVAGAVLLMVLTFTALTLALGSPIYDKISESVDAELSAAEPGGQPASAEEPLVSSLARAATQSLALIAGSGGVGRVLFLAGFVPVVGQVVVPVLSAVFGGWMLCIELVGSTFERRGRLRLAERRAAMRSSRARVLGFAVPTFLLLAVPFVAVVVFPAAIAGATILARDLLGPVERRPLGRTGPRGRP